MLKQCIKCGAVFENVVRGTMKLTCPQCGSYSLRKAEMPMEPQI